MENLISCKSRILLLPCLTGGMILLVLVLFSGFSRAEDGLNSNVPIHVVSDQMTAVRDESSAEFTGNVVVTREDAVLKADRVRIYFASGSESDPDNEIRQIIAEGNVEYISVEQKATAERAVYTSADETLVLTGKEPRVTTGTSYVSGEKITLYQKTGQVIVEGGTARRVEAVFNPGDQQKN